MKAALLLLAMTALPAHAREGAVMALLQQEAGPQIGTDSAPAAKPAEPEKKPEESAEFTKPVPFLQVVREFVQKTGLAQLDLPKPRAAGETIWIDPAKGPDRKTLKRLTRGNKAIEDGGFVQITAIIPDGKRLLIDLNGGGLKKEGFHPRIESQTGASVQLPQREGSDQFHRRTGVTLEFGFDQGVPEQMSLNDFRVLLSSVVYFPQIVESTTMRDPLDLVPPQFREAVHKGYVVLGMDPKTAEHALKAAGIADKDTAYVTYEKARDAVAARHIVLPPGVVLSPAQLDMTLTIVEVRYLIGADEGLSLYYVGSQVAAIRRYKTGSGLELPYP